mgnify:CR=1 FL=1
MRQFTEDELAVLASMIDKCVKKFRVELRNVELDLKDNLQDMWTYILERSDVDYETGRGDWTNADGSRGSSVIKPACFGSDTERL